MSVPRPVIVSTATNSVPRRGPSAITDGYEIIGSHAKRVALKPGGSASGGKRFSFSGPGRWALEPPNIAKRSRTLGTEYKRMIAPPNRGAKRECHGNVPCTLRHEITAIGGGEIEMQRRDVGDEKIGHGEPIEGGERLDVSVALLARGGAVLGFLAFDVEKAERTMVAGVTE